MLDEQWKWQHVYYMRAQRILHACAVHTKQIKPIFYRGQIADTIYRLGHDISRYMSADRYIGRALLVVMRSFFFDVVSTPFVHLAALFKTHQRWSPSSGGSALLCAGIEMATNLRDYPMPVALLC